MLRCVVLPPSSVSSMDLTFYNEGMEAAQAGNVPFRSIRYVTCCYGDLIGD